MTDNPRRNGNLVDMLGSALREGGHAMNTVPDLLLKLLQEDGWRDFVTQRGEAVHHNSFADFVSAAPLAGLGEEMAMVKRVCGDRNDVLSLIDKVLQNPVGHPAINNNIQERAPQGTSRAQALRKLRTDSPELHAEVLAGKLSAHAAMVQAGFRPKTATVRTDSPEHVAAALRRLLSPEDVVLVAKLLRPERE